MPFPHHCVDLHCLFSGLLVVHFTASWAPQCKQMAEVIDELVKDNVHVKFLQVCALL
jgi:thiol-disulfide isomerase/thioredoxin